MAVFLFAFVAESVCGPGRSNWTLWHWVIAGLALYGVVIGFVYRKKLLLRTEEALETDGANPRTLKRWQAAHFVGMTGAESVAIWGVVDRMVLGGTFWQASLFYATGLVVLLLWTPRMPNMSPSV
jgi:hypothetical protein